MLCLLSMKFSFSGPRLALVFHNKDGESDLKNLTTMGKTEGEKPSSTSKTKKERPLFPTKVFVWTFLVF